MKKMRTTKMIEPNKKAPDGRPSDQSARENIQIQDSTGFDTCQDIQTIKAELARVQIEMDSNPDAASRAAVRYWAIRWVMGWEKEIPK